MTRKSTTTNGPESGTGPDSDANNVVAAIRDLTDVLKTANQHHEMIGDEVRRVRKDINWIIENRDEVVRIIHRMPRDPADPAWSEKLAAMNSEPAETVSCAECDTHYDSLAEAARAGADRITEDKTGLSWNWLCVCRDCQVEEAEADAKQAAKSTKPVPKRPRTLF